jgi:Asp-tRNA(Asn)/Glu-tRNA(Gln) amidotransferase A subunit family amidase
MNKPSDRRRFLKFASKLGVAGTLFPSAVCAIAQTPSPTPAASTEPSPKPAEPAAIAPAGLITKEMIDSAAAVAGLKFADEQKIMMLENLNDRLKAYEAVHDLHLANGVAPAIEFNPVLPGMKFDTRKAPMRMSRITAPAVPKDLEEAAFYSVRELSELVRTRRVSSMALTEMYLARLKRYDPLLKFVITLTEDRAKAQAKEADRDLAAGRYRGPLHGLPWGAKDLLATKGYRTTWGAGGFENQMIDEDATVVKRLDAAGAVLVAKLTLGALAMGDVWFGGLTRNPWKPDQGSSGSSAGPASATAAGCVGFAVGSETLGSISSPCTRCGATGLRPTFGRVPRTGAMALSWSMDKLGPICRSVEDCALVLNAICGPDGFDRSVHDLPFNWDASADLRKLRIGYVKSAFEREAPKDLKPEDRDRWLEAKKYDMRALTDLREKLEPKLIPVELPDLPFSAMRPILIAEGAAAFDELTRSGRDRLLTAQTPNDWPNAFRAARFIPAIEYINANRARMLALEKVAAVFKNVDVVVAPTFSSQLLMSNLTGHPAVILPSGFRADGTPVSLTFLGKLFGEAELLLVAKAYQDATGWHLRRPPAVSRA